MGYAVFEMVEGDESLFSHDCELALTGTNQRMNLHVQIHS